VVAQVQRENMEFLREVCAGGLPVAGRAEQPVQDDKRRMAPAAKVAMKELNHRDTEDTENGKFNPAKILRALRVSVVK